MRRLSENPACNIACRTCHYKDLSYDEQIARKRAWAEKQLAPWASVLRPIIEAPENERLGYRSKSWMMSHLDGGELSFGKYRSIQVDRKWVDEFVSWDTCPIHSPAIREIIGRLESALAPISPIGVWFAPPHIVLITEDEPIEAAKLLNWREIMTPPFDRVWLHSNSQVGRKVFGHKPIHPIWGNTSDQTHPIGAFRQVAHTLLQMARARAIDALMKPRPEMVVDLYCGTGELADLLPPQTGWLGIELSRKAVEYANERNPAPNRSAFIGTIEDRLKDPEVIGRIQGRYSLYLNPPRPGLSPEAHGRIESIMERAKPQTIAYLSCNASSLARDLVRLERHGFRVESLQPYDFFPQTEHFETLAVLVSQSS